MSGGALDSAVLDQDTDFDAGLDADLG